MQVSSQMWRYFALQNYNSPYVQEKQLHSNTKHKLEQKLLKAAIGYFTSI